MSGRGALIHGMMDAPWKRVVVDFMRRVGFARDGV